MPPPQEEELGFQGEPLGLGTPAGAGLQDDPIAQEGPNEDPQLGDAAGAPLGLHQASPGAFEHEMNQRDTYGRGDPMPGPSALDEGSKAPQPARWEDSTSPPNQFRDEYNSMEASLGHPPGP